jgi:predicted Zn-dependent peptidase
LKQSLFSATLDNGITLVGEELPDLESVAVAFHLPAGGVHDGAGRCGLATLTGEMCLRGAGDRDSRRIVEDLESAGVQWSQAVSTSHMSFSGAMVSTQLPVALPIYADILRRPLPAEGLSADVERLTAADVRVFATRHLQPGGMIVSIAGRIDWPDFVRRIERHFGNWQPQAVPTVTTGPRGPRIRHVPHESQQTHIALAWSAPPYRDDESYDATAAVSILGGGSSSRLFTEVRERRGLCYSVSAGYQTHRDFAIALCYAGTTAARSQETLDVMLAEIQRLPGSLSAAELDRVKARAKSGLVMQQESSAARAGSIARQWYHLGGMRTLAEELARYDRLSVASIEAWLAGHPPRDVSVVCLGPEPLEVPHAISA